jgi:hypothetical protein
MIQYFTRLFELLIELVFKDYKGTLELRRSINTYSIIQRKTCSICSPENSQNSSMEIN